MTQHMPERAFDEIPEIDITDQLNELIEPKSGIQEKELGEHVQDLHPGDDTLEILTIALNAAVENDEPESIITCEQNDSVECQTLEQELERRREHGTIDSFTKNLVNGKVTFHIRLEKPSNDFEDEAAA